MNRLRAVTIIFFLAASQIPAAGAATYVANVQAVTLQASHVEFYVAYVVTTLSSGEVGKLPGELRNLCAEFPRLDHYHIAIITDPRLATSKDFRDFALSRLTATNAEKSRYREAYLAEWGAGRLTAFPADAARAHALPMRSGWCNHGK